MEQLRILITGANGAIGSEIVRQLSAESAMTITKVSANESKGTIKWQMGSEPAPKILKQRWDVIIHCAANTRWTMSSTKAHQANVLSTAALSEVLETSTRLIHISTAFAVPSVTSESHRSPEAYRNSYEWSKAEAEAIVDLFNVEYAVIRPPLVIGRRADGHIARYAGVYTLAKAYCGGLLAAVVGKPDSYMEIVPTCDVASLARDLATCEVQVERGTVLTLARGENAMQLEEFVQIVTGALDKWRMERSITPLHRIPIIDRAKWERFFRPFLEGEVSSSRLNAVSLLGEFEAYTSLMKPMQGSALIADPRDALERSITAWATANPRVASRIPTAWKLPA